MAETLKAHDRRVREGFFEHYINDPGIDIGCAYAPGHPADALNATFRRYDLLYGDGDAQLMADIPSETFLTVYASHILEHVHGPVEAIRNWFRILKPGGFLIIDVPHMLLYEKQSHLPSRWNEDHKTLWMPSASDRIDISQDDAFCQGVHFLDATIHAALKGTLYRIAELRPLDEGYQANGNDHAGGEYSIECIVQKELR